MTRSLFQMGFQGSPFRPLSPAISLRRRMGQEDGWGSDEEDWNYDGDPTPPDPLWENPDPVTPVDEEPSGFPGVITSPDEGPPSEGFPGVITSPDQGPPSEGFPGVITSPDQGPPSQGVPGAITSLPRAPVIPAKQPPGMSDTDYAKLLAEGLKLGLSYYTQEQVARMKAEADKLKAKNPATASILSGGTSTGTYILIGLGAVGLVGLIALLKGA